MMSWRQRFFLGWTIQLHKMFSAAVLSRWHCRGCLMCSHSCTVSLSALLLLRASYFCFPSWSPCFSLRPRPTHSITMSIHFRFNCIFPDPPCSAFLFPACWLCNSATKADWRAELSWALALLPWTHFTLPRLKCLSSNFWSVLLIGPRQFLALPPYKRLQVQFPKQGMVASEKLSLNAVITSGITFVNP